MRMTALCLAALLSTSAFAQQPATPSCDRACLQ
jgi:hypothetical protein